MKKIINKIFQISFAIGLTINQGNTQTLPEFISTALTNNYQIRILKNNERIASNNDAWGNAGLLPTVSLSGGISTAFNNTRQEFSSGDFQEGKNAQTGNINLSALANWTVFDGFGVYARKEQLEHLYQQGQVLTKFYIEQTIADITAAYYQLVYQEKLLKNFKSSLSISNYRYSLEKRKREVGTGTEMSFNQALVDYKTDSIRFLAQTNLITTLELEIKRILGIDLNSEITITQKSFDFAIPPHKDSLLASIKSNSYQLESTAIDELIAEAQIRIEKANRYPTIDVYGGYQFAQSNAEVGFISLNRNRGPVLGLNINFNLFDGGNVNRAIANAKISKENAEITHNDIRQNITAEGLTQYELYHSLLKRINLARENVSATSTVFEIAKKQLEQGSINAYDFRLVQLTLINAESSLLEQEYLLKLAEINLNRIVGRALATYYAE